MKDYWIGSGKNAFSFVQMDISKEWYAHLAKQREYLEKIYLRVEDGRGGLDQPNLCWPFIHARCFVKAPWFSESWLLDPLVVPFLYKLNSIPGVRTYTSCQGTDEYSPSIEFLGDFDAAKSVSSLLLQYENVSYTDRPILSLTGTREIDKEDFKWCGIKPGKYNSWHIWFYDQFALMKFTRNCLGISIHDQIHAHLPKFDDVPEHSCTEAEFNEEVSKIKIADPAEIESIIQRKLS
jgi:hypothetical protein